MLRFRIGETNHQARALRNLEIAENLGYAPKPISDREEMEFLVSMLRKRGLNAEFYRVQRNHPRANLRGEVVYSLEEMEGALETGLEFRSEEVPLVDEHGTEFVNMKGGEA